MREKIADAVSETKTIYATMFTLAASILGQQYYQEREDPRPDPFTGTQGQAVENKVEALSAAVTYFIERGPVDVIQNQNEILRRMQVAQSSMMRFSVAEEAVRKQHNQMAKDIKTIERVLTEEEKSDDRFHRDMEKLHEEHDQIYEAVRKG